jgi:Protein of unknown function (DUF1598)
MPQLRFSPRYRSAAPRICIVTCGCLAWFVALTMPLPVRAQSERARDVVANKATAPIGPEGTSSGRAGAGGAANADFDSLIDLIESTVASDTWSENGGGTADIREFPEGVLVDAAGTLQLNRTRDSSADLARVRGAAPPVDLPADNPRRSATLRYISLPRLEREIARRQAAHEHFDAALLTLAGLQRIEYVFVYPESGDLVLAGRAGDWYVDPAGRLLAVDTDLPVVRLDDLLVLLRRGSADSEFGCAITPRQQALAATQSFLAATSGKPLEPGERGDWLGHLRDALGKQDIDIWGIDPASHAARILVAADYHMKLIGMGLADGVPGVESYLDSLRAVHGAPPPMSVLRWWFTPRYDAIRSAPDGNAYQLVGQGVCVLSENELLAAQGRRVHTGQSDPLNRQFAERFTAHFAELAKKYPVYGELRNIFDLSLALALIQTDGLADRVGWHPGRLADGQQLRLPQGPVPRQVETVVNSRVIDRRRVVAGVSGGVRVDVAGVLGHPREVVTSGPIVTDHGTAPNDLHAGAWWWDQASD